MLPWNDLEKQRLNLQHTVVTRNLGGLLPSSVTVGPNDRILDACTGTGVWSFDLASQVPSTVEFQACDISDINWPDQSTSNIHTNIHFSLQNALSLPPEWTNTFDIVHQRLLITAFTPREWTKSLKELFQVTCPGGYIVLCEINLESIANDLSPVPATRELGNLFSTLLKVKGMVPDTKRTLLELLQAQGFEIVQVEDKVHAMEGAVATVLPDENDTRETSLADDSHANMLRALLSLRPRMIDAGLIEEAEYDRLLQESSVGWKDVQKSDEPKGWRWVRICARKPEA
jgi:ubiquinone/menaquinone biosynthesis C-methylase UbiE